MSRSIYNIQCLNGHVFAPEPASKLEDKCIERAKRGFLDALTISPAICPFCIEQEEIDQRRFAEMSM